MTDAFPDPYLLRVLPPWELEERGLGTAKQVYEVTAEFRFRSALVGEVVAPRGFITDFGSVPDLVPKWIADGDKPYLAWPSLPHDVLYWLQGRLPDGRQLTRKQCDQVLREAMKLCGASLLRRWIVYGAVRAFGWIPWRKCTPGGATLPKWLPKVLLFILCAGLAACSVTVGGYYQAADGQRVGGELRVHRTDPKGMTSLTR